MERARPSYPISSVDRALRLLLLFRDRQVVRLSEAGDALGVARSTAHRLLAMLQAYGFVRQDPDTRAYVAGPALIDVGLVAVRGLDLTERARPYLEAVSATVGETTHLTILQGRNLVFVDSVESPHPVRTGARIGVSLPAHCTSGGKAILAGLPPEALAQLYEGAELVRLTGASIGSFRALERELEVVRRQGYATNLGESETDIAAVGVAIPPLPVGPRAALAVSAPASRLRGEAIPGIARILRRAAAGIAERPAPGPSPPTEARD
jgi:DNA-binding IclR family transcriptional regulator